MNDKTLLPAGDIHKLFGDLSDNWGWLLALGILFVILGTVGLGTLATVTVASVLVFGVLLLIGGGAQVVDAFKCQGWKGRLMHILIGLLYLAAGAMMVFNPVGASISLTLFLAWLIVAVGVVRIVIAIQHRGTTGWVWTLVGGLLSLALGAMILVKWPLSGLVAIGLFVSIEILVNGWSTIFLAMAARKAGKMKERDESLHAA